MVELGIATKCPSCNSPLSQEGWSAGMCPSCLLELALDDTALEAEVRIEPGEAPTLQFTPDQTFSEGQIQGDRYRIRSLLGRGGMGEVWRAYDLKLRQDVALKALRKELIQNPEALGTLRQEVRVAREVISPNVCRVFDLQELDGQELVSMEYIDGTTLQEILAQRSPLELNEAREIASQFLAGLEAIHEAGLIHRDIKPENVMVTRTGRVVVMDFGIAKGLGEARTGTVAGTPAYMSPEQSEGGELDARTDVFSAGVVLAEMVDPGGTRSFDDRRLVWETIHHEDLRVSDTSWSRVIGQATAGEPEQRYATASGLARALEEVTLRAAGDEEARPYPGLSAFRQEDAHFFFGRELEVEALWKKLRRPHLLTVIGPSGAGKSSFLRAGLLPTLPEGWRAIITTPGSRPFDHLAQVLASDLGDAPGVAELLQRFEEPDIAVELLSEWRRKQKHGLLIVDQFEELFTQSPQDVQGRFAELLSRLPLEANVHVLLSMRDDFLFHCQSFESLLPLFSELTPLGPPTGASLRRAIVQPALKCGYRFEDESIVEEMLAEVEGERGALPMMAFAAARLWEERDRETGLLNRETYEQIGGVCGALAQHAEATLETIGEERIPIVRELFRNLVTAQGTRAARDRQELLSVFSPKRPVFVPAERRSVKPAAAESVLSTLIDARLLTSYEVPAANNDDTPHHSIEIVHESLLSNWPRLVRWQMQDQEGAQLRDELRHQAHIWEEKGRPDDLLWTGTSFQEFQLWRQRYPGGLTATEEDFGRAMTARAERRKRRRRIAVAAAFTLLLSVLAIVGGFWRRSVTEARRAEAANLFVLAKHWLEAYPAEQPTDALAFATASLELADNPEVRRLALEALWRRPSEFRLPTYSPFSVDFSPDGRWLATASPRDGGKLWPADGGPPTTLEGSDVASEIRFSPRGDLVAANLGRERQQLGIWTLPGGRLLRTFALGDEGATSAFLFSSDGERVITATETYGERGSVNAIRLWSVAGGQPDLLARLSVPLSSKYIFPDFDRTGSRLAWADGRRVHIARREGTSVDLASVKSVDHDQTIGGQIFDEQGRQLATSDVDGTIRIWSLMHDSPELTHTLRGAGGPAALGLRFDPSGSMLAGGLGFLWDLGAPPDAEPLRVRGGSYAIAFDPRGRWLVTPTAVSVPFWPLDHTYPRVLPGPEGPVKRLVFTPDGKYLVATSDDRSVQVSPLDSSSGERSRVLYRAEGAIGAPGQLAMAPDGSFVVIGNPIGEVVLLPLDGGPPRRLSGFTDVISGLAVGPQARLVAAGAGSFIPEEAVVRVWDLATSETRILNAGDGEEIRFLRFTAEGDLLVRSGDELRRWDLAGDAPRVVAETSLSVPEATEVEVADLSPDGRRILLVASFGRDGRLWIRDLDTDASRELTSRTKGVIAATFDPTGSIIVSGDTQGIRVGSTRGGEPHLLLARERYITYLAVSPDGRWIASEAENNTIRLWPMPDLEKTPLHSLPRDELLAKLRSLTNLRAVEDPDSPDGWKIDIGPFPGWEEVPTWQ